MLFKPCVDIQKTSQLPLLLNDPFPKNLISVWRLKWKMKNLFWTDNEFEIAPTIDHIVIDPIHADQNGGRKCSEISEHPVSVRFQYTATYYLNKSTAIQPCAKINNEPLKDTLWNLRFLQESAHHVCGYLKGITSFPQLMDSPWILTHNLGVDNSDAKASASRLVVYLEKLLAK